MTGKQIKKQLSSIGFHYYNDTEHYTKSDLENFLAEIDGFPQAWLVLQSETSRTIPEFFLKGLHSNGVKTIVQIKVHVCSISNDEDLALLLHQYGEWGVRCVQLAGYPNMKSYWGNTWLKTNVAEEFAAGFIEFAKHSIAEGLVPVMSTLVPGGDFWDTVFLHSLLEKLSDEKDANIIQSMALAAGGWTFDQTLDFGLGGHDVWSDVRPYHIPENCQSQMGLNAYEWYLEIAREVLGCNLPTFIFYLGETAPRGQQIGVSNMNQFVAGVEQVSNYLFDAEGALTLGEWVPAGIFSGIPQLRMDETSADIEESSNEKKSLFRSTMASLAADLKNKKLSHFPKVKKNDVQREKEKTNKYISHYLLLPVYDWGVADWHLEVIKPFIQNHQPTIGFSIQEAQFSEKVTVVGDETVFSKAVEQNLKDLGCVVERISGDGTEVASQMAVR